MSKLKEETAQYLPYATDFLLASGEDLKKLSTKALNHRIKYLLLNFLHEQVP